MIRVLHHCQKFPEQEGNESWTKRVSSAHPLSAHAQTPDEDNVLTVNGLKCKTMINARCQSHLPPGGNLY